MAEHNDEERERRQKARNEARALHDTLSLVGLRAQATSAGLVQLVAELVRAKVLEPAAIERIRDAIARDILVSNTALHGKADFERTLRERLKGLFPDAPEASDDERKVGSSDEMGDALGLHPRS